MTTTAAAARRARLLTIGLALAAAPLARAATSAEPFALTRSDLSRQLFQPKAIADGKLTGTDPATGKPAELPLSAVVSLARPAPAASAKPERFTLVTRDGQRWVGRPEAIRGDAFVFQADQIGTREVPVANVERVIRGSDPSAGADASGETAQPQQDDLRLANGDRLRGVVSAADASGVTCQTPDGQPVTVAWQNVRALRLALTQPPAPHAPAFRVGLANGTRTFAEAVALADGKLTLDGKGDPIALADVVAIEQANGGEVRMLAWTTPERVERESFFPSAGASRPAAGGGVNFDANAVAYGAATAILARPRCSITWPVAATGGSRFHARLAVPGGRAYADVTARVLAGDRVVFEQKDVKSGDAPLPIDVALDGAAKLTLQVDFGANFDVQDEALWLDAAVVAAPAK